MEADRQPPADFFQQPADNPSPGSGGSTGWCMLRLADISLAGRRVLTIETDYDFAADMAQEILRSGGILAGASPGLSAALSVIDAGLAIDCAMVDTNLVDEGGRAGMDALRRRGIEIVFVTGFDEWFDDEEQEAQPLSARA